MAPMGPGSERTLSELFDPYSDEYFEDPWAAFKVLRDHAPVYGNEEQDFYAISRYQDVLEGLKNWEALSSTSGTMLSLLSTPGFNALEGGFDGHSRDFLSASDRAAAGTAAATDYFAQLAADRSADPGTDFVSRLAAVEFEDDDGEARRMHDLEIAGICVAIVAGGSETTMKILTSAIAQFSRFPGEWEKIVTDTGSPTPSRRPGGSMPPAPTRTAGPSVTWRFRGCESLPVPTSCFCLRRGTATSAPSRIRIASTSIATCAPTGRSPGALARTNAWAWRSLGSRRESPSRSSRTVTSGSGSMRPNWSAHAALSPPATTTFPVTVVPRVGVLAPGLR
jgi:hypothetical protein